MSERHEQLYHLFITNLYIDYRVEIPQCDAMVAELHQKLALQINCFTEHKYFTLNKGAAGLIRIAIIIDERCGKTFNKPIKSKMGVGINLNNTIKQLWKAVLMTHKVYRGSYPLVAEEYHGIYHVNYSPTDKTFDEDPKEDENIKQVIYCTILRRHKETHFSRFITQPLFVAISQRQADQVTDVIYVELTGEFSQEGARQGMWLMADKKPEFVYHVNLYNSQPDSPTRMEYVIIVTRKKDQDKTLKGCADYISQEIRGFTHNLRMICFPQIDEGVDSAQRYSVNTAKVIHRMGLVEDTISNRNLFQSGYYPRLPVKCYIG